MQGQKAHWSEPEVKSWTSLWCCLHDASLASIHRDELAGTLELLFTLGFPDPEGSRQAYKGNASFTIEGLSKFRAFLWRQWPGDRPVRSAAPDNETWNRQLTEWLHKGWLETASLEQFQGELVLGQADVMDAQGSFDNHAALELEGTIGDGGSFRLLVAGKTASVKLNESCSSVEDLMALGARGWEALERRGVSG